MNVTCTSCGKRYVIAEEKLVGKSSVKIRCKQCQSLVTVRLGSSPSGVASSPSGVAGSTPSQVSSPSALVSSPSGVGSSPSGAARAAPAAPARAQSQAPHSAAEDEGPTQVAAPLDPSSAWFAMVRGSQVGPLALDELVRRVSSGEITRRTYLWKPGMADWKRAYDVPEVSAYFAHPASGRAAGRDVATSNELPSPELIRKPVPETTGGNGRASHSRLARVAVPIDAVPTSPGAAPRDTLVDQQGEGPSQAHPAPSSGGGAATGFPTSSADTDPSRNVAELSQTPEPVGQAPGGAPPAGAYDPFATADSMGDHDHAAPLGEATRFFIAQAGLHKRNPVWKIALAVVSPIALLVALLYLLSSMRVVQLPTVTHLKDDGSEVQESVFSTGGLSGLKDVLTGETKRRRQEAENRRRSEDVAKRAAVARRPSDSAAEEPAPPPRKVDQALAELYAESADLRVHIPKNRNADAPARAHDSSGLSPEAAQKTVQDKQKAFELCIDNALRRTPNLNVGAINVILKVGGSGVVSSASIDPKRYEGSDWAQCMMNVGRRIVFPSSDGETELVLPFKVGASL